MQIARFEIPASNMLAPNL